MDSIPLILPFHHSIYPLRRIILKHYNTLMTDQNTKDIFKFFHITSYKRKPNLGNHLVRASDTQPAVCCDAGTYSSKRRHCNTCIFVTSCSATHIKGTKGSFNVTESFTCISKSIVYGIICKRRRIIYIGETCRRLADRITEHIRSIRSNFYGLPVARHCTHVAVVSSGTLRVSTSLHLRT